MPLKTFPRSFLKASELVAVGQSVYTILGDLLASDEHLNALCSVMKSNVDRATEIYGIDMKNPLTERLAQKDELRDILFQRTKKFVAGSRYHIRPEVADAGVMVYTVLKKHGLTLDRMSYAQESTALNALLLDSQQEAVKRAIKTIGADEAFSELEKNQKEFEEMYIQKVNQGAASNTPTLASMAAPLRQDLFEILVYLGSRERINPAKYSPVVERINEVITEMAQKARSRLSRNSTDAAAVVDEIGQEQE